MPEYRITLYGTIEFSDEFVIKTVDEDEAREIGWNALPGEDIIEAEIIVELVEDDE